MSVFRASRAWVLTALLAIAYLIVAPPSADLAAQQYRTDVAKRAGLTIWDNAWYGGHHMPGYSVLFPPLGAALTPQVTGALAAVLAAWLYARMANRQWGANCTLSAWWFAAGMGGMLLTGRLTFALGLALGLAATSFAQRNDRIGRIGAPIAAFLCTLGSPVSGLFLTMVIAAWFIVDPPRRWEAVRIGAAAFLPALFLTAAFPEGGVEPFHGMSYWPALAVLVILLFLLPKRERALRVGIVLYILAVTASFLLATPMGNNVNRLGALFAGPILAGALWPKRRVVILVCALPLLYWQFLSPVQDWRRARDDASVHAEYYTGLRAFLRAQTGPPFRIEVPFTRSHWETRYLAADRPLARGWERQLDIGRNDLFYEGNLTPARYRRWLDKLGVRFVAVPQDVMLDHSAEAEAALVRRGLPYLRPVWRDRHWRVYEVQDPMPIARGGAELVSMSTDGFTLRADRPGTSTLVHIHWTPYWQLRNAAGCVSKAPGDWTRVTLKRAGTAHVATRFSLARIRATSPRCSG